MVEIRSKKIRVLIVEDSAFMRKQLKRILESDPEIEVIGMARDGEDGVAKARELMPDIVTMDVNLPGIDGITALQYIINENICPVLMVSSLTQDGSMTTFEALELGAFDYVPKPGGTVSLNIRKVEKEIIQKIKTGAKSGTLSRLRNRLRRANRKITPLVNKTKTLAHSSNVKKAVAIGISTGGPKTLMDIMEVLPEDLDAAIFVVQHMPASFTASFANRLDKNSKIKVVEANAGDIVQKSTVYIGKGGYHLCLRKNPNLLIQLRLTSSPEHLFIPSVGIMMESVLEIFGSNTIGILMTGMGDDGADAMVKIKNAGGITIAESEETAIVFGMPQEAILRGGADLIVPSYKVAEEIVKAVGRL